MAASTLQQVAVTSNTESQVIGPNPRRVRLLFCPSSGTILYVRPDSQGNTAGGIGITSNVGPTELSIERHGDIVKGPWFGFSATTQTLGVLETVD